MVSEHRRFYVCQGEARMTQKNKIGILTVGRPFRVAVLLAIGCALTGPACAADIPSEYVDAIRQAEAQGLALYEAEQKGSAVEDKKVAGAKGRISTLCDFSYKAVRAAENGQEVIYLLGQAQHENEMTVGRHFRIIGGDVQASSRSCLTLSLGTPQRRPVAVFVTHLMSPTPTLFHVYLSLKYKIGIDVGTSAGNWAVEHGVITFLQARGPEPGK
jgi:hypothetical protein